MIKIILQNLVRQNFNTSLRYYGGPGQGVAFKLKSGGGGAVPARLLVTPNGFK